MTQFEAFAAICAGFISAFTFYAVFLSDTRLAFVFWFPFISVPIVFMVVGVIAFALSSRAGPGAPLEGVANIAGVAGIHVSGIILWLAIANRPSAKGAYRSQIIVSTLLAYGLLLAFILRRL